MNAPRRIGDARAWRHAGTNQLDPKGSMPTPARCRPLQTPRVVFTEQGAACRGLLLLRHPCRFMYRQAGPVLQGTLGPVPKALLDWSVRHRC
jgi:hypothetical protein